MTGPSRSRREFLQLAATTGVAGAYVIAAPAIQETPASGPPVSCAVIGVGQQGRRLLSLLATSERATIQAFADVYAPYLRRGQRLAPEAQSYASFQELLEQQEGLEAIFVATPTHLHRDVAIAAIEAGKHVYCEAPMASTSSDANAMAAAAQESEKIFAVGLQLRANRHFAHALGFVEVDAIGHLATDNGSHHVNMSWRRAASDPDYEKQLNWRLSPEESLGLFGEHGVHAFDTTSRATGEFPQAVSSFGSLVKWKDGRQMPDTVQCIFEYQSGFQSRFESTLANSHGGQTHHLHGTAGSILLTEKRCWLFKEVDAPSFGWEVYATRERVISQDAIVLVADATKLLEKNELPGSAAEEDRATAPDSLDLAVEDFLTAIRDGRAPAAGLKEGANSVVMAEAAVRSLRSKTRVEIDPAAFRK